MSHSEERDLLSAIEGSAQELIHAHDHEWPAAEGERLQRQLMKDWGAWIEHTAKAPDPIEWDRDETEDEGHGLLLSAGCVTCNVDVDVTSTSVVEIVADIDGGTEREFCEAFVRFYNEFYGAKEKARFAARRSADEAAR